MKPKRVRLFIKPWCGWCQEAVNWLDDHGVEYEVLDVTASDKEYDTMERLSGQSFAPVIDVDGEILANFGPDQLARFWQRLEQKYADAGTH